MSANITILSGNNLTRLFLELEVRFIESIFDPFVQQQIVVPNPATARWLIHRLAIDQGIAANLDMPLPASFFWRVLRAWLPDVEASPFDPETLVWRMMAVLPDFLDDPAFAELRHYLDGDDDPVLKRFQLVGRIAETFDQYLVYRPEMVLGWEDDEGEEWQPRLWRSLAEGGAEHRARLLRRLLDAMDRPPSDESALPPRIFLFGINSLPPIYIEILRKLAAHRELLLFHLNPCREYWRDIRSERSIAHHEDPQAAFLEVGNPLLASMGHVGQVFFEQLLNLEGEGGERGDAFVEPAGAGALPTVQRDILDLVDGVDSPQPMPEETWPSIQFHGAHTPLREAQILHNNLLRCLDEIDGLTPKDILVMAPDMAAYAPFVEAVFGTAEGARHIPYSIGERAPGVDNPLADAIEWLLELPASRMTASEVLALLEVDAVQRRLGIDAEALERMRRWITESGIRWGIDAKHREELKLPGDDGLHSWWFGLRRLFLGYVTPVNDEETIYGAGGVDAVPYLDIEGGELPWAGALQTLIDRIDHWRGVLASDCSLEAWQTRIADLLAEFFDADEDDDRALLQTVTARLDDIVTTATGAGFDGELPLVIVRQLLGDALEQTTPSRGFLDGGVTFSNLLPMRALPFRVICLLGMNDADFPRRGRPPSFDLIGKYPRRDDRDRRRDDRYVFLETLISARDCLLISWQSRDVRSDKPRLPAEVVSELMDYLDARFTLEDETASKRLFIQHPLQPFDRRYFDGSEPRLFSYDDSWAIAGKERVEPPFVEEPIEMRETITTVQLDELIAFFRNPAAAFLATTLGIRLPGEEDETEDNEPFMLDGLARWELGTRMLPQAVAQASLARMTKRFTGEGRLPHGLVGEIAREEIVDRVEKLSERIAPWLENNPWQPPMAVKLAIAGYELVGSLDRVTENGIVDFRIGRLRAIDRLLLWLRHLVLAASVGEERDAVFVAEDETFHLRPVACDEAKALLAGLLDIYQEGLREPLPFFPETSWAFANEDKKWREAWDGGYHCNGESEDAAIRLAFRNMEPLDETFKSLARKIWSPIIRKGMQSEEQ